MATSLLTAKKLNFGYGKGAVLTDVSLEVKPGQVLALLGANGAGKSTLLRLLLGLEKPSSGEVLLAGRPLAKMPRRDIAKHLAYVPQHHVSPFPYLVEEVVAMGLFHQSGLFGRQGETAKARALAELDRFHLSHLAKRPYTQISGGQRQLVLMCRALMQGAKLLLLDEPASALDFGHQARLLTHLQSLAEQGFAVLMSSHHPQHAAAISQQVLMLKNGRVMAQGPTEQTLTAANISTLYDMTQSDLQRILGSQVR
ncbi:ABC transporter ATP-binding protein [Gallaecimonas mangrovi]|uniref:ABC transporter ATP-binding protein n=1 Tax=Gallaecimonas mangrovi TaxID=2291597 RepID=UPI000E2048A9|nr:ABC transporter ATP-binding protein [Gallaecimonas mangrovi]